MTTLTDDQIASYRGDAGDVSEDSPEVTDPQIQAFYDKAVTFGNDDDTTYAITMVYYIRRLMGLAVKKIDTRGEVQADSRSQIFDHLKDNLLPYWEGLAGMSGGGRIRTGALDMNIDYTCTDLNAEATDLWAW